jgi:hypothetical protein
LTAQFTVGLVAKRCGKYARFAAASKVMDIAFKMMKKLPEVQEVCFTALLLVLGV